MPAKSIMIQGTGSGVGKSIIVAALCRIFKKDGFKVAPFKAQNMALNSFVTRSGGEMGRSQVVQAQAAGIEPQVEMNPILIKPTADTKAQIIVLGHPLGNFSAMQYHKFKTKLLKVIEDSYQKLATKYDIVVIEGAGSPAEVNLREGDIVNMETARMANSPVILVGDIDKGGVFAWLWGTIDLLSDEDRKRVKGIIINKFRGDKRILKPGLKWLEEKTGCPVVGVIPFFKHIRIHEEDSLSLDYVKFQKEGEIKIEIVYLPHISNFTDFDPLMEIEGVSVRYVGRGEPLSNPDAVIIPGTKNTIDDLTYLIEEGYVDQIRYLAKKGKIIMGICGGFQMLGKEVRDPWHIESKLTTVRGIDLLDAVSSIDREKITHQVKAIFQINPVDKKPDGENILYGYEIHMGSTDLGSGARYLFKIVERSGKPVEVMDGAVNLKGNVFGTYIHGIFDNPYFTSWFVNLIRSQKGLAPIKYTPGGINLDEEYDKLCCWVEKNIDKKLLYKIVEKGMREGCCSDD